MWVISALAGLAGLITLALCIPVDAVLSLDSSERPKFRLRLVWLFGLLSKELKGKREKAEKKESPAKEKPKKRRGVPFPTLIKILRTKGLFKQTKGLLKSILSQLKLRELMVNLRLGLDDPADAGLLFAVIGSTEPFLKFPPRYEVKVEPFFSDEFFFEGYLKGALRVQPIKVTGAVLRFVCSRAMLRVLKTLVSDRWKRKK